MKRSFGLILAVLLFISSAVLMISCDISAEGNESELTPEITETPAPGKIYGDYQIITVTDEETLKLLDDMLSHDSWMHVGLASNTNMAYTLFEENVITKNTYLNEVLAREDGIDLLIWQFERYVTDESGRNWPFGATFLQLALRSDSIYPKLSEEQKAALDILHNTYVCLGEAEQ